MRSGVHSRQPTLAGAARIAVATLIPALSTACADSLRGLGPSPAAAETHAEQLFDAFTTRFAPNDLAPRYDAARNKLAQAALVPSRVFNDTSVWESRPSPTSRAMYIVGAPTDGGRYHLETRAALPPAARPGDSRHAISLEQVESNVYRWDTRVDLALGALTAEEMSVLITSLLTSAEGKTEGDVRADYRAAFPRGMAAFGHGFAVDSLRATPGAQGTTSVLLVGSFHPELMKPSYPALAGYLDKYLGPAKYHFALADRSGGALFDVVGANRTMSIRWRVQRGKLTSLFGPARAWPDTAVLTADVTLKVKVFTVGVQNFVTDFVISNSGHERGWSIIAQKEPKWVLPFITERLIRSPLRRPFEGEGAAFRLLVRDSADAQTMFSRRTRLDVQESAIMRFLGSLGAHVMGDLDTRVEVEEDRFLRDGFGALRADLQTLAPRWSGKAKEE